MNRIASVLVAAAIFFAPVAIAQVATNNAAVMVPNSAGGGGATNLTGDVTSVGAATSYANVVPVAKGGVPQGAWTAFTASPSCGTATFTVNSARWPNCAKNHADRVRHHSNSNRDLQLC
jgi:hypothetical protein